MKTLNKICISASFIATLLIASCTEKFDEPAAFEPANLTPNRTIQALKSLYSTGPYEITDSIIIAGKVVSTDENGNFYRSFYIQDGTGGIEVKVGKTTLYNEYKEGQTIYIKARHLFLGSYGGMVQLGERSVESKYETSYIDTPLRIKETIFRGKTGEKVTPQLITKSSDVSSYMLGTLVTLKSAKLTKRNMSTWAKKATATTEADYGEHTFQVSGGLNIVVRTSGYAKFANQPAPALNSVSDVTGVLTKYGSTWQLVLNSVGDVHTYTTLN